MASFNANNFNRQIRQAQQNAQRQLQRQIDQVNRANKQAVDAQNRQIKAHNQRVDAHNRRVVDNLNAQLTAREAKINAHNRQLVSNVNRQVRSALNNVRYTETEQRLADRVHEAVAAVDPREYDSFLSYARIDGSEVAAGLRNRLEGMGVAVWFDAVSIVPGRSQSLQMDAGLRKARSGIALLTPAYLTGRFWTERELGALLSKSTLIPVLHNVSFDDVREYSGILPDLAGFSTEHDSVEGIAAKIADAVLI